MVGEEEFRQEKGGPVGPQHNHQDEEKAEEAAEEASLSTEHDEVSLLQTPCRPNTGRSTGTEQDDYSQYESWAAPSSSQHQALLLTPASHGSSHSNSQDSSASPGGSGSVGSCSSCSCSSCSCSDPLRAAAPSCSCPSCSSHSCSCVTCSSSSASNLPLLAAHQQGGGGGGGGGGNYGPASPSSLGTLSQSSLSHQQQYSHVTVTSIITPLAVGQQQPSRRASRSSSSSFSLVGQQQDTSVPVSVVRVASSAEERDAAALTTVPSSGPPLGSTTSENSKPPRHDGVWVKGVYTFGRLHAKTKLWTCCNSTDHLSLCCPSWEARHQRQAQINREAKEEAMAARRKKQAAAFKEAYLKRLANEKLMEEFLRQKRWDSRVSNVSNSKVRQEDGTSDGADGGGGSWVPRVDPRDFECMRPENIPTLVTNMFRFLDVHFLQNQAVALLCSVCGGADGRLVSMRSNAVPALKAVMQAHLKRSNIVLPCVRTAALLCEDQVTRPLLLSAAGDEAVSLTSCLVEVAVQYLEHEAIAQEVVTAFSHLAKDAACAELLFARQAVELLLNGQLAKHAQNKVLVEKAFRCLSALAGGKQSSRLLLLHMGTIFKIVQAVEEHTALCGSEAVLEASVEVLRLLCMERVGRAHFQSAKGLPVVLQALKTLWARPVLQEQGMLLIASVCVNKSIWTDLDQLPGAWQWLSEGTDVGRRLIEYQPKRIGRDSHETLQHDQREAQCRLQPRPCYPRESGAAQHDVGITIQAEDGAVMRWDALKFMDFVDPRKAGGRNRRNRGGMDQEERYFRLVTDLRLLPWATESRGDWKQRVREYEAENGVDLAAAAGDYRRSSQAGKEEELLPPIKIVNDDSDQLRGGFSHWYPASSSSSFSAIS